MQVWDSGIAHGSAGEWQKSMNQNRTDEWQAEVSDTDLGMGNCLMKQCCRWTDNTKKPVCCCLHSSSKGDAYAFILAGFLAWRHRLSLVFCLCGDDNSPLYPAAKLKLAWAALTSSRLCSDAQLSRGNQPRETVMMLPQTPGCLNWNLSSLSSVPDPSWRNQNLDFHRYLRVRSRLHFCALFAQSELHFSNLEGFLSWETAKAAATAGTQRGEKQRLEFLWGLTQVVQIDERCHIILN